MPLTLGGASIKRRVNEPKTVNRVKQKANAITNQSILTELAH